MSVYSGENAKGWHPDGALRLQQNQRKRRSSQEPQGEGVIRKQWDLLVEGHLELGVFETNGIQRALGIVNE